LGKAQNRSAFAAGLTGKGGGAGSESLWYSDVRFTFILPIGFVRMRTAYHDSIDALPKDKNGRPFGVYGTCWIEIEDSYERMGKKKTPSFEFVQSLDLKRCLGNRSQVKFSKTKLGSKFDRI